MAKEFKGLTVSFGANTAEFDKSVKGVNKALSLLKKDFQNINKELRLDPDNVELMERELKNLEQQSNAAKEKIKLLKEQQEKLGKDKIGSAQWQKLQIEIEKTEHNLAFVDSRTKQVSSHMKEVADPKSVYNLNKALAETGDELEVVNKKLQLNPDDVNAAAEKIKLIEKYSKQADEKVEALRKEQKALGDEKIGTEEWRKLEKRIVDVQLETKELKGDIQDVGQTEVDIGGKLDTSNMLQASDQLANVGNKLKDVGFDSVEAYKEVDNSLDIIVSKTGEAKDGYNSMVNAIAGKVPVDSFDEIGSAIGEVRTQFNLTGKDLKNASEYLLKFSKINDSDVTTSTINAKKAIELFNLDAKDLPKILDAVTKTSQSTGVGVDDLFSKVQTGASALQNLGLDFYQSTELIGQFEQAGFNSSKMLGSLKKASVEYAKDNKSLDKGLEELSKKIKNAKNEQEALSYAAEVFGTRNAPDMVKAIKDGKLSFEKLSTSAKTASGAVEDTFQKQMSDPDKMKLSQQKLQTSMGKLGETLSAILAPALEIISNLIEKFVNWFGTLDTKTQTIIVVIGAIITAILTLTPIIIGVATAIGVLNGMLAATGTTVGSIMSVALPVILGIVAAITVVVLVWKNWSKIVDYFSKRFKAMWEGLKLVIGNIVKGFKDLGKKVINAVKNMGKNVKNFFKNMIDKMLSTVSGIGGKIAGKFKGIVGKIKKALTGLKEIGKFIINKIVEGITGFGGKIGKGIKGAIARAAGFFKGESKGSKGFGMVKSFISNVPQVLKTVNTKLVTVGGASTSLNITVNANGQDADELAEKVARKVEKIIVRSNE